MYIYILFLSGVPFGCFYQGCYLLCPTAVYTLNAYPVFQPFSLSIVTDKDPPWELVNRRATSKPWTDFIIDTVTNNVMVVYSCYAPETEDRGAYCFYPICHSVIPFLCQKFNLANNFWTVSARTLIFHMSIPCDKTFWGTNIFDHLLY